MADVTIHDLSARSGAIAASDQLEVDDGNSSTDTEKATFAQLGGLAYSASSVTTGNVTATVGTLHALDLSGLTADRNFVLPDSAQVGERIGVFVTTGDDTYELDIVTAATGSLINGANAGGGTSWSRLFITNECCVFRCVNAGGAGDTDWIVEYDGRIPCRFRATLSADTTGETASTFTNCGFDTAALNVGNVFSTSGENAVFRRSADWEFSLNIKSASNVSDREFYGGFLQDSNGVRIATTIFRASATTVTGVMVLVGGAASMSAGDTLQPQFVSSEGSIGIDAEQTTASFQIQSNFCGVEVLN